ncbi:endolytic transglycosylase MltG [Niallia sp. Sow4_A1]|uniref:endolytic transglycosylase MltG n=1 Tax=Bacillaceae TaxID=186817 RepID=UPI001F4057C5|nr:MULTISPECIES: endolytic transglycosylase MltG [Bacillaceae]MCF2646645.1 endolytic transglycosylase MltG [Niallia circulans]MCM3360779.1 endolytic transglycosylase MltG [Niallia sp. MER TA 168]CAI9388386.1 Endolytic murein transglycosylase [Bacillus sp. T2.9-1]
MTKNKDEKNASKSKKELFLANLNQRQQEAKLVRRIVAIVALILIIIVAVVGTSGYFYIKSALQPVSSDSDKEIIIDIPIGSGVSTISQLLEDNGLVKNAKVFKYYVKFKNESNFMAGEYHMNPSMTIQEIIESLKTGKIMQEPVFTMTIPEGKQLKEIAAIIAEKTNQKEEEIWKQLNDETFIKGLMAQYPDILTTEIWAKNIKYPLEGYLFPATYSYYEEKPTLESIISVMLDKTESVVNAYETEIARDDLTVHQFLTMSSLIEEEATKNVDRKKIASVFYNRIEEGMPLQTDPTVLYALGEHKDRVLYEDLEVDSPYNTYQNVGLPPGPIANAGTISMEAALHPEETDYLYFLASKDGKVYFSKSLNEHNELKAKYITENN